jgi:hypothetical protein
VRAPGSAHLHAQPLQTDRSPEHHRLGCPPWRRHSDRDFDLLLLKSGPLRTASSCKCFTRPEYSPLSQWLSTPARKSAFSLHRVLLPSDILLVAYCSSATAMRHDPGLPIRFFHCGPIMRFPAVPGRHFVVFTRDRPYLDRGNKHTRGNLAAESG